MCSGSAVKVRALPAFAAMLGCWLLASSLWAGEARLLQGASPDQVVIETSDANVDEVLAVLATHFEFAVERSAPDSNAPGRPVRFSGRLQGTLDELLERLLRHEGHMIVRSAEARAGIGRIVLLDAKGRPPAPTVAGPIAAIKSKLQSRDREEAGK